MTTGTQSPNHTVDARAILEWIDRLRCASVGAPEHEVLDFDGIDALDVLLSPIYLAALNALRRQPRAAGSSVPDSLVSKARQSIYRLRVGFRNRQAVKRSAPGEPVDVLLWTRDITHTVILHPVAKALSAGGTRCALLACQPNTFEQARDLGAHAMFARALWPGELLDARREGERRAQDFAKLSWSVPTFPGRPEIRLTEPVGKAIVDSLPLVSESIANARLALDRLRVKVLVVGNDLTLEGRAGCLVAARQGVPTAMFMHGSISADPMQGRHLADRVLVYGATHRQELVQQGIAAQRIVVCGAPNLDERPRQTGTTHPLLQARLGLKPGDPWLLVATSGPGHRISHQHHQEVIQALVRLCLAFPTLPVVVKLHRKDRLEYYRQGLEQCKAARLVVVADGARDFPQGIFQWLQGCRAVLTGASAVAVEAMLMEVPVITMDFRDEVHDVDFIDARATEHVRTVDGLIRAVRTLLEGGPAPARTAQVDAYLQTAFFALDGQSAKRGAQALRRLMSADETT